MSVNRPLPGKKFIESQFVAFTGFFETQESATYRSNNFCLAPNGSALGIFRWKIRNCHSAAVWPDDIAHTHTQLSIGRDTHYTDLVDAGAKATSKRFYSEWQACHSCVSLGTTLLLSQDRVFASCHDCAALSGAA